ncbi:baseplate protein [Streptomyces phage phiScoe1]|nr:baseplate protein [Streptomyces phage phiScoe1]
MGAGLFPPPVAEPIVTTTGLVAATNFTVVSFYGSKINGICMFHAYVTYTPPDPDGAGPLLPPTLPDKAGGSNIVDTLIATLPSGYRPPTTINFAWGDGTVDGEGYTNTTGGLWLRTISTDQVMPTGRNIRITGTFIL